MKKFNTKVMQGKPYAGNPHHLFNEGEVKIKGGWRFRALMMIAVIAGAGGAWAATWQGGASGDFNDPANWNGDIATEALVFTQSATVTLSADTNVYRVFSAGSNTKGITVVLDLNGHDLGTTASIDSNRDWWRQKFDFVLTNSADSVGTFTQKSVLTFDQTGAEGSTLLVSGGNTVWDGAIFNRGADRFGINVADGATLSATPLWQNRNATTNLVSGGAKLLATTLGVAGGAYQAYHSYNGPRHDNLFSISNATASGDNLYFAHGQPANTTAGTVTDGAPYDNVMRIEDGAQVSYNYAHIGCGGATTNNTLVVSDNGTIFDVPTELRIGTRQCRGLGDTMSFAQDAATNAVLLVENGAIVSNKNCYIGAGGNVLKIRSGATFEAIRAGGVYLQSDMTAIKETAGTIGSRIEIEGGTLHYLNRLDIGTTGVDDVYGHEVFVGAGGLLSEKPICFRGNGDRLVVSNGTVSVTGLQLRFTENGKDSGTNGTVRIEGKDASVGVSSITIDKCSPTFEFAIPEDGWTEAPFRCSDYFTIPEGFSLKLDEKALKAYRKAHPSGGTVPLMRAYSSYWKTITVSDEVLASLNAGLPDGCEIVVSPENPLSVKIKSSLGMRIILR